MTGKRAGIASKKHRLGRLPKRTPLGRGYNVRVFLVSERQIRELMDLDDDDKAPAAFWDDEAIAIYVDQALGRARQWKGYFHEMVHAAHDVALMNDGGI